MQREATIPGEFDDGDDREDDRRAWSAEVLSAGARRAEIVRILARGVVRALVRRDGAGAAGRPPKGPAAGGR